MNRLSKLYISSLAFTTIEESAQFCRDNNVALEIGKYARADMIDNSTQEELDAIKKSLSDNNIKDIAWHGACFSLCPSSMDDKIVEVTRLRLQQSLQLARQFEANTIVFHSGYNSHIKWEFYKSKFVDKQVKFWQNFIKDNEVNDIIIALENTYEEDPQILYDIYEGVGSEYFKNCLDIGHICAYSNYDVIKWVKCLDKHLWHFHIHNNNGSIDEHLSVLKGKVDFDEFFNELANINRPINYTLEIFEVADVVESLNYVREKGYF